MNCLITAIEKEGAGEKYRRLPCLLLVVSLSAYKEASFEELKDVQNCQFLQTAAKNYTRKINTVCKERTVVKQVVYRVVRTDCLDKRLYKELQNLEHTFLRWLVVHSRVYESHLRHCQRKWSSFSLINWGFTA